MQGGNFPIQLANKWPSYMMHCLSGSDLCDILVAMYNCCGVSQQVQSSIYICYKYQRIQDFAYLPSINVQKYDMFL